MRIITQTLIQPRAQQANERLVQEPAHVGVAVPSGVKCAKIGDQCGELIPRRDEVSARQREARGREPRLCDGKGMARWRRCSRVSR